MADVNALIYAVEDIDTNGEPKLEIYRKPGIKDLDYDTVKGWGIQATGQRPDFVWFRGDLYLVGGFTRVLVRHRNGTRWWPAGIRQPDAVIQVVEGAGSGGSPGEALCYATFVHKQGPLLLAESNPSNLIQLTGQTGKGYDWTLQTSGAEERVTDVRLYRSMNGGSYRLAAEVPYGTGTFFENVKTNQLLQTGPDGHYLPPFGLSFAASAFGRMWYARTNDYPYRIWGSLPNQPQYVPLTNYRDTDDRETIMGLAKSRDVLLVFCLNATYILRKHGSGSSFDFTLQKVDSAVGCVSHWGIKEIHNKIWFPATDGIWIYDGGFRYVMEDMREFYAADFKANELAFRDSWAVDDRSGKNYYLNTPRPDKPTFQKQTGIGTVVYVGNYVNFEPSMGGQNPQPDWSLDTFARIHKCGVYSRLGDLLISCDDAKVRKFDEDNADDDADAHQKELRILTGHNLFMEPGDDIEGGKLFKPLWAYVESEYNDWTMAFIAGDEAAARRLSVDNLTQWWKNDITKSEHLGLVTVGGTSYFAKYVPQSVHAMVPESVAGRGLSAYVRALKPQRMAYRGIGGFYLPGAASRGPELLAQVTDTGPYGLQAEANNGGGFFALPSTQPSSSGFSYTVRGLIYGSPKARGFCMVIITHPSGTKETFAFGFDSFSNPEYTPTMSVTMEIGVNTVDLYFIDADGIMNSNVGNETLTITA